MDKRCRKRTPVWADRKKIRAIYKEAKFLGKSVDHIIPLIHPRVSGLHVHTNLQLLTLKQNIIKSNNWYPDQLEIFEILEVEQYDLPLQM